MSPKRVTKDELDKYLREIAKEYRKLCGKRNPAEIILIGGASILLNYNFRDNTEDVDAIIGASSAIKDAINHVGDKYGLPTGWFNSDFERTTTYSPNLILYSKYYHTYSNIVQFRTISGEYLLAMKLMAFRMYKNDKTDVIGIIMAEKNSGNNITMEMIEKAVKDLYGDDAKLSDDAYRYANAIIKIKDLDEEYQKERQEEIANREILMDYFKNNPKREKKFNSANEVIEYAKKLKKK